MELRARHRAAEVLEAQLACLPQTAWRIGCDEQQEAVTVQRLCVGDLLKVPLGQAFAADGVIEDGQTLVDKSLLTGESAPVAKQRGASVIAGSINQGGRC